MHLNFQVLTIFYIFLLINKTATQCPTDHTLITVYYQSTPIDVCVPQYSIIKHCLIYWTSTPVQKYATLSQLQCRRCGVYTNEQFIVNLATLATSNKFYMSCIPNSFRVINCEYYIEKVYEDRRVTFECGNCSPWYPTIAKGGVNEYSFCLDKPISNCLRYGQAGLDRFGLTKVKCDTCEAKFVLDFATSKCLSTIENCASYDQSRKCTKCNTGFQLNDQLCIKPEQISNQSPFLPQTTSKTPLKPAIQSPCLQFSRRSLDTCIKCKQGYTLWNGQCLLCSDGSYINAKGQCFSGQFPNCAMFNQEGLCLYCKDGYKFNNNLTACVSVNATKKCPQNTSRVNYVMMNNVCVPVDVNCKQKSFGINGCYDCKPGFYIWEGVCYFYR